MRRILDHTTLGHDVDTTSSSELLPATTNGCVRRFQISTGVFDIFANDPTELAVTSMLASASANSRSELILHFAMYAIVESVYLPCRTTIDAGWLAYE